MVTGLVVDSTTGAPVPFALVILEGTDLRVFANDAGRFSVRLSSGGDRELRIQQIGYAPVRLPIRVEVLPPEAHPESPLTVRLSRRPYTLPDLVVESSSCEDANGPVDAESDAILSLAFENAERLVTLERAYPSRGTFLKMVRVLDTNRNQIGSWADTIRWQSGGRTRYRAGRVLQRQTAVYFSAADIASPEFRKQHCIRFGGRDRDSASGIPLLRITFVPTARTRTPDWAGSLLLDSATAVLLRSEAQLVNIPRRSTFGAARCIVDYAELAPTLVYEARAVCAIARMVTPPVLLVERWSLLDHAFVGPRPDSAGPSP
jgi:hypothetical protein